jgi:apolipoprotein D and lipocalin family protein
MRASIALVLVFVAACSEPTTTERLGLPPVQTVQGLELDRYLGTWFEIGSYPNEFQKGCEGTTATYALKDNGEIDVRNSCTVDGRANDAQGVARAVDLDAGKLEVSFFGPFFGDYWVVELGEDETDAAAPYTYAVVTSPSRDFLWILSRTSSLEDETLDGIFARLAEQSIDRERFNLTPQP